jgi:hypothetical protein
MATIDLADPQVIKTLTLLALLWGVAVALVVYSIAADVVTMIRGRKPKRVVRERTYRGPCGAELHVYDEGATSCSTCGTDRPVEESATPS